MSASDVVSIAFASTGLILLCTTTSNMLPPRRNDLATQTRRAIPLELLSNIEAVRVQPVLALGVSLYRMHVASPAYTGRYRTVGITVFGCTPSTSAVSSTLMPPK